MKWNTLVKDNVNVKVKLMVNININIKDVKMMDYEIHLRVERERQRIIEFLKGKGITRNSDGERLEDLPLLPLTLMENKLI